jgi:hypothetical protein
VGGFDAPEVAVSPDFLSFSGQEEPDLELNRDCGPEGSGDSSDNTDEFDDSDRLDDDLDGGFDAASDASTDGSFDDAIEEVIVSNSAFFPSIRKQSSASNFDRDSPLLSTSCADTDAGVEDADSTSAVGSTITLFSSFFSSGLSTSF